MTLQQPAIGDRVLIRSVPDISFKKYIGNKGAVVEIMHNYKLRIKLDEVEMSLDIHSPDLIIIPPETSPFHYGDAVRVIKDFERTDYHICKIRLLGKTGEIRGYDKRDETYLIRNLVEFEEGWFPSYSLIPIDYRGNVFYLPNERVWYKDICHTITKIKKTKFNWGQLLYLEGEWVPSSEVRPFVSKS